MKLEEIQNQLRSNLPLHTERFNTWKTAVGINVVNNVATVTTIQPHGFDIGDYVNIKDVDYNNAIASLEVAKGKVVAKTQYPNDMTAGYTAELEIIDSDITEVNGVFINNLQFASDRFIFSYTTSLVDGVDSGSAKLVEKNLPRYNNRFEIKTVPDSTSFTIEYLNDDWADFTTTCSWSTLEIRVGVAFNLEHADSYYTKQNNDDWWMFITPTENLVSKNRGTDNDFTDRIESGVGIHQEVSKGFFCWTFVNVNNSLSKMRVMDECNNEILRALSSSLLGYQPSKFWSNDFSFIHYKGETFGPNEQRAYYVHGHEFATTFTLTNADAYCPNTSPLNKIDIKYYDKVNTEPTREIIANDIINYEETQ